MKRIIVTGIAIAAIVTAAAFFLFSGRDTIDSAISEFEAGDYDDALRILNRIVVTSDYDMAEKIHYYRCKSINRFAQELEDRFEDELKAAASDNQNSAERDSEKKYVERKLAGINTRFGTDLVLTADKSRARIIPGGRFYQEFVSKFRGSQYIEDLDFEEVERAAASDRERFLGLLVHYYSRYPATPYLSELVKMLLDNLGRGGVTLAGREEFLNGMIISFCRKYPTSSEFHRFFTCTGESVNFRDSPSTSGKVVGKIEKDALLVQLEKSMDMMQIGDTRDYWYRISDLKGRQGWIFGKFLATLDISRFSPEGPAEQWAIEDSFSNWPDSNTPENWVPVEGAERSSITFYENNRTKRAKLDSPMGNVAGLFRRVSAAYSFEYACKGRFGGGESFVLMACSLGDRRVFSLQLGKDEIMISGMRMPLKTGDWHEYRLSSVDGKNAKLFVDGELISNRIPSSSFQAFSQRGIYCLYSSNGESSKGEVEYVKFR